MSGVNIDIEYVQKLIKQGYKIERVSEITGYSAGYLRRNFSFLTKLHVLGHKDCAYFDSEEEMLNEPVYTYESLSDSEKAIYDELADDN